jgi:hypothetical protein
MIARILADIVVIVHLLFIIFVIFGGLLILKWKKMIWIHVPIVFYGFFIEIVRWICPLTPLENWLRAKGGEQGYTESFVEHYILPVIYPDEMTRGIQIGLGVLVLVVNLVIYGFVIRKIRRNRF